MQNIKSFINNHNMKVLNYAEIEESCSCRNKNNCPLDGKCLALFTKHRSRPISATINEKFT